MIRIRILLCLLVGCTPTPTEYPRDNPVDPTGDAFDIPDLGGLTSTRVDRHIKLTWTESFDRHRIIIERSLDGGPFVLADSLESGVKTWADTTVAFPDSIVYQYRVFGRYLDNHTDTLMSYRITSLIHIAPIQNATVSGDQLILSTWTVPSLTTDIVTDLQTFYFNRDSTAVFVEYEDGSRQYVQRISQPSFKYPVESEPMRLVITQHSRGRVISEWKTDLLHPGVSFGTFSIKSYTGQLGNNTPLYVSPSGKSMFLYDRSNPNSSNETITCTYTHLEEDDCPIYFRSYGGIRSVVDGPPGQIIFLASLNAVLRQPLHQYEGSHLHPPGLTLALGSYNESGELFYLGRSGGFPIQYSLNRYNVVTQTLVSSLPVPALSPTKLLDRPEKNEIWIFEDGLMRMDRATGDVLQEFDSDEQIFQLIFRNGKGYATFFNRKPYVKIYDMGDGRVETIAVPIPYEQILFLPDGRHVLLLSSGTLMAYDLLDDRLIAKMAYSINFQTGFLPDPDSTLERFTIIQRGNGFFQLRHITRRMDLFGYHPL